MKKVIVLLAMLLIVVGCNLSNTPSSKVEIYLNSIKNIDEEVEMDIETKGSSENLSNDNKDLYKKVLRKQYEDLKYEIKEESINGDEALVTCKITVYDLHREEVNSINYMNEHTDEFNDSNGIFSNDLFNSYRLNQLNNTKERIDYDVTFYLDKKNGEWVLQNPDKETLEKINGFYDYENN